MRYFAYNTDELKNLLRLALPVLSANIFGALMELCDTLMASLESNTDLMIVSKVSALWFPILFLMQNMLLNTLPLIVRARGAQQPEKIKEIFWNGLWLTAVLSTIGFILLSYAPYLFATIFSGNEEHCLQILTGISRYCTILRWGCPAFFLFSSCKALADGAGQTVVGTKIGFSGLCSNIFLNYFFVYGSYGAPKLGGAGCAVATVLSYWLMTLLFLGTFFRSSELYKKILGEKIFRFQTPKKKVLLDQFIQGGVNGLVHFIESAAFSAAIFALDRWGAASEIEVASIRITSTVCDLLYLVPLSIGIATTMRIGGLLGAKSSKEALHQVKSSALFLGMCGALINCLALLFWRHSIAACATHCQEVRKLSAILITYAAIYQLPEAIQVICFGILRAYQKLFTLLALNFFAYWLVAMPVGLILGLTSWWTLRPLGAIGFWIGLVVGLVVAACLAFFRVAQLLRLSQPILE